MSWRRPRAFALRLHVSAAPTRVGLTQALGGNQAPPQLMSCRGQSRRCYVSQAFWRQPITKRGTAMTINSLRLHTLAFLMLMANCFNANAADLTQWSHFDSGKHPDYVGMSPSTEMDIIWCVWHEGLHHQGLAVDAFRQQCAPMHKGSASKNRVLSASNKEIRSILGTMDQYFNVPANGGYKMLFKHLRWVLHHEGQRARILNLLDQGNFTEIRSVYHEYQSHHAHVEYLIYAASDEALRDMINQM
jgi:hypothetical protein